MSRLLLVLFVVFIVLDAVALGVWFLLGLAAAKPSHTPVLQVVAIALGAALLLAGLAWLHLRGPWPGARAISVVLAGLPVVLLLGGALASRGVARLLGESADNWGQTDPDAQQRLEEAIRARDPATVTRIAGDPRSRISEGAALVLALRQLEEQPSHLETLRALLAAGVSPNTGGGAVAPLAAAIDASRHAGAEPVRLLLAAGADPNYRFASEPAWFAALSRSTDSAVLPMLLDRGADLGGVNMAGSGPVYWAASCQNWEAAALLVERGAAWRTLQLANGQTLSSAVNEQLRRTPDDAALQRLDRALRASR
ncbi:MAG: hypothetical protein JNL90_10780 [Planctomycetes bacterium]|nr:hypothetical protein [Planctomycetota bacterium]